MSHEALDTSAIEGEVLDRDSVQSSIRRQLGLAGDRRRVGAAEAGIAEMMVSLYRSLAEPLDHDRLHAWHRMVMNGRRDLEAMGRYRTHREPMQIVSGAVCAPKVHFEAPPSEQVQAEMDRFLAWFEDTAPAAKQPLPALTRVGLAPARDEGLLRPVDLQSHGLPRISLTRRPPGPARSGRPRTLCAAGARGIQALGPPGSLSQTSERCGVSALGAAIP
jgi:hypothetical protein